MKGLSGRNNRLLASSYSNAAFFLCIGPMIAVVIFSISMLFSEENSLQSFFMFLLFGYLFGAVPAAFSGAIFGLAHVLLVENNKPLSIYIVIFITCISGALAMALFLRLFGIPDIALPSLAFVTAMLCSILRARELKTQ